MSRKLRSTRLLEPSSGRAASMTAPDPASDVGPPLAVIVRWSRVRLNDRLFELANVDIDNSAVAILGTIVRRGPLRMSELAEVLGLDRSTVSRQVAAAMSAGLVVRSPDQHDARASVLSMTDEGRKVQQKLAQAWHRLTTQMVAGWSAQDQTELVRLLSKLTRGLEPDAT